MKRPLSWLDQEKLRWTIAQLSESFPPPSVVPLTSEKPGMRSKRHFADQASGEEKSSTPLDPDLTTGDVMLAIRRHQQALQRLVVKHLALLRVREICKLYQQKRRASGPLARSSPNRFTRPWRHWSDDIWPCARLTAR